MLQRPPPRRRALLAAALREEAVAARLRRAGFLPFTRTPALSAGDIRAQRAAGGAFLRVAGAERG